MFCIGQDVVVVADTAAAVENVRVATENHGLPTLPNDESMIIVSVSSSCPSLKMTDVQTIFDFRHRIAFRTCRRWFKRVR